MELSFWWWILVGYIVVDIITSQFKKAEMNSLREAHTKSINTIKNVLESQDSSSDEKVKSLKLMFDNKVIE